MLIYYNIKEDRVQYCFCSLRTGQKTPLEIGVDIDSSWSYIIEKDSLITSEILNIHNMNGNLIINTNIFKEGAYIASLNDRHWNKWG